MNAYGGSPHTDDQSVANPLEAYVTSQTGNSPGSDSLVSLTLKSMPQKMKSGKYFAWRDDAMTNWQETVWMHQGCQVKGALRNTETRLLRKCIQSYILGQYQNSPVALNNLYKSSTGSHTESQSAQRTAELVVMCGTILNLWNLGTYVCVRVSFTRKYHGWAGVHRGLQTARL